MGIDKVRFAQVRPCLYHLTARANLKGILSTGGIDAASELIRRSAKPELMTEKRPRHVVLAIDGREVVLRDQAPLHRGNARLEDGLDFAGLVGLLNDRVYFWPGTEGGPIGYGVRHFERYAMEDCVVLVASTNAVLDANGQDAAEFCRYNSGSPRCSGGVGSPRGRRTFLRAEEFDGRPSEVVEVTFRRRVGLPGGGFRVSEVNEWL